MALQTITALFDSREYANNAVLMLKQAGVPDRDVTVSPDMVARDGDTLDQTGKGFWASLENMFGGTDDHETYAEGIRRGQILVTAHVAEAKVDNVVSLLEQHGSVDMNERETAWRSEGWTGGSVATAADVLPVAASGSQVLRQADTTVVATPVALKTAPVTGRADDVIQVVEESLSVGKRAVNRGKVRLHTSVVERAVSENIALRDETVTIDRRPVDRALGVGELGIDAFKDRTIEMDEIDEEAVVSKTARVVEEISLRKDAKDAVRTVSDTVRSTKVDIEDGRTARVGLIETDFAGKLVKDMEVVGSDGQHVGTIDHVDGAMIKLKRLDPASGGTHHLIPTDWVASVDKTAILATSAADAKSRWTAV